MTDRLLAPVVVTGAASGIGAALTSILRDQGRKVIGLDRVEGHDTLACDLGDPQAIAATVDALPERLGGLANVAGVPGTAPASTVLRVNVLAPILLSEALAPRLEPTAAIVNVASVAAHRNVQTQDAVAQLMAVRSERDVDEWLARHPIDGSAAYDTSKRVLVNWTALQAARLIDSEVRCISVSPGPVETPILQDFATSMGQDSMDRSAAAVGRHGRPEEIAAVVAFALSGAASWLNGIDIPVEGGLFATRAAATLTNSKEA